MACKGCLEKQSKENNVVAKAGSNHRVFLARPIPLGVSGGVDTDLMPGFCCGGTLGFLASKVIGGVTYYYAVSCMHVLAQDIVLGLNNRVRAIGDWLLQPALIDTACNLPLQSNGVPTNAVGQLVLWNPITPYDPSNPVANVVDGAMAQAGAGLVRTDGLIYDVGYTFSNAATAFVGLPVKKAGRTTDLTTGTVTAVGVTILVGFTQECGGASYAALFTNQIQIEGPVGSPFSDSGDSGSLVVTIQGQSVPGLAFPAYWPVGLLFAGGGGYTFANPIANVMSALDATIVGPAGGPFQASQKRTETRQVTTESSYWGNSLFATQEAFNRFQMRFQTAINVKDSSMPQLFGLSGVIGAGIVPRGDGSGTPTIRLYLTEADPQEDYPTQLGGFEVSQVVTGPINASRSRKRF